jgi:hypothetical protein
MVFGRYHSAHEGADQPFSLCTKEAGWNDASSGPLLPSLQARYDIRYLLSEYRER